MKTCFKCKAVKPEDDFYKHSAMKSGVLGKCKECTKIDVRSNYAKRRLAYAAYYQKREQTEARKEWKRAREQKLRLLQPEKYKAHYAVSNAIRDGRLTRKPCEVCGNPKVEAHHHDYSKPLDAQWLCFKHHRQIGHGQLIAA